MTKGKWMLLLALLLGTLLLIGCSSKEEEKTPAPNTEQTQKDPAKEEPKTEAPKTEAPKTDAPATEAPKTEVPKAEEPKTSTPTTPAPNTSTNTTKPSTSTPSTTTTSKSTLTLGHDLSATYANNCKTCHAGGAMLSKKPPHVIDATTASCTTCHTLKPKA